MMRYHRRRQLRPNNGRNNRRQGRSACWTALPVEAGGEATGAGISSTDKHGKADLSPTRWSCGIRENARRARSRRSPPGGDFP